MLKSSVMVMDTYYHGYFKRVMGEGVVLKLVYSPVSVQEASEWNWSAEPTSSYHLHQLASPDAKPGLCAYRTAVPKHK